MENGFKSTIISSRKRSEIGNFCGIFGSLKFEKNLSVEELIKIFC